MGKEEIKVTLFTDGMTLYVANLKKSPPLKKKKLLELINKLLTAAAYKINIQKLVVFL